MPLSGESTSSPVSSSDHVTRSANFAAEETAKHRARDRRYAETTKRRLEAGRNRPAAAAIAQPGAAAPPAIAAPIP